VPQVFAEILADPHQAFGVHDTFQTGNIDLSSTTVDLRDILS
jgi:hypothetical protein